VHKSNAKRCCEVLCRSIEFCDTQSLVTVFVVLFAVTKPYSFDVPATTNLFVKLIIRCTCLVDRDGQFRSQISDIFVSI